MIQVTIFQDSSGGYKGFRMKGHAGFGEAGQDIICAAVSVLTLNTANAIEAFTEDSIEGKADENAGMLEFRFCGEVSRESKLLIDTLVLGLKDIQSDYGKRYIKIRFEEV